MARTAITVNTGGRNTMFDMGVIASMGQAIDQANGMSVKPKDASKLVIFFYNSDGGGHVYTIKAGAYPPAESQTLGDLALASVATLHYGLINGLEGARFLQTDGNINIDFDASSAGRIYAIEMPA